MIDDAIKKINDEFEGLSSENRVPAAPIVKYLTERLQGENDEELAANVMQEHKTMHKCFDFVYEQAKNHLGSKNGWIEDGEVYAMAVDYFTMDDAELERKKAEEAAKKAEENARRNEEDAAKAAEVKAKKDAETKAKKAEKKAEKNKTEGQISLF